MKLTDIRPQVESSGELQEQFFSIKDQGMIFDILRNKMYSNPILAICREISSNARDAHREIGTPEKPVVIHLPTGLEPDYKIKDFGPGISPDRMSNIFIQYTASTKRDDNIQTGGFGLGAKTPFSYSDTFTIITVVDNIRYNYACFIDETKVGKLALLSKESVNEPNSTEISIPVKPVDFHQFNQWTEQACRHWDVKPIIKGGNIVWQTFNKIIEGDKWAIIQSNDYYNRSAKLVIDGIEYPLEIETLKKYADHNLINSAKGNFLMYFGVGELSLSASREQIYLDKPTQEKIRARLSDIQKEIKQRVTDKIANFPNLWEANLYYRKELMNAFSSIDFLGKLMWKTHELNRGYINLKCKVFTFTKGKYSHRYGSDPDKLTRTWGDNLSFEEHSVLFINDLSLKEPTPRHVKKAFDDNPKLHSIQVICPDDKQSEDDLNKLYALNEMAPGRLSDITKATGRKYTAPASRLLVFKLDSQASAFRQVSYDSMEEDTNEKVICMLTRQNYPANRMAILSNKKTLSFQAFKSLEAKFPKVSFYGVDRDTDPTRITEEFNDFEGLEKFITKKIVNSKIINYVEIKFAQKHSYDVDERVLKHWASLSKLIKDTQSFFIKRMELHEKIKKLNTFDSGLLEIYESVKGDIDQPILDKFVKDNPEWDILSINQEYATKYPLLGALNVYNYSQILEHVAHYINMVDKI